MRLIIPLVCTCGVLIAALGYVLLRRRQSGVTVELSLPTPSSGVHVLHGHEEFLDAVNRAASFERGIAERVQTRSDRYAALITSEKSSNIHVLSGVSSSAAL